MQIFSGILRHFDLILQGMLVLGLVVLAWMEARKPRVPLPAHSKWPRWQTNIVLYGIGAVCMAYGFDPVSERAIGWGGAVGWGGLAAAPWPTWVKVVAGLLVIDLLQYALHMASHYVPWWWRLHKIHHSDTAIDASTAIRHHPLETALNSFLLVLVLAAVQVPLYAIVLYGALQQVHTLFCHANLQLPAQVDAGLRWLLVTPDMHAVHHSMQMDEGNSNFGMVFPWWDRVFRSYRAQPQAGLQAMRIGIAELAGARSLKLLGLLGLPWWRAGKATASDAVQSVPKRRGKRR